MYLIDKVSSIHFKEGCTATEGGLRLEKLRDCTSNLFITLMLESKTIIQSVL